MPEQADLGSMEIEQMGIRGQLARVRTITEDDAGFRVYLSYASGTTGYFDLLDLNDIRVGSLLIVDADSGKVEIAPQGLWPSTSWVGVVKLKIGDEVVVDAGARLVILNCPTDFEVQEGNTIEVREEGGIVLRLLSEKPIKFIDLPGTDAISIDTFRIAPEKLTEQFSDFGGSAAIVSRARELIEAPLKYSHELASIGARPIKGVLFTGPPGTGKTMLARIIASSSGAEFYQVSGPEIFSKWYGQSEELLRTIFEDAASQERAIIFFDEIDSVAGQRSDGSHEASRRVVAQLLTLMDGFTSDSNVVVVATTNRPQDIDAALRRPGRFDWEIEFSLPDQSDRRRILEASARRLNATGYLPHEWVSRNTEAWSAAELTAIWSESALLAVADSRKTILAEDYIGGYERVSAQRRQVIGFTERQETQP